MNSVRNMDQRERKRAQGQADASHPAACGQQQLRARSLGQRMAVDETHA